MKQVDVLIVGAGIHGAGVAQAAAAQGRSVLLVERATEVASETSRASSKLIHGGLRYLESGQFRLVYECLRERRLLLKNAPALVKLQPFYIPVYKNSKRHPLWIGMGLALYWALSGFDRRNRFRRVAKQEWPTLGCTTHDLRYLFQYFDGQTDDQALTQAVLQSAQAFGAEVLLATEITEAAAPQGQLQVRLSSGQSIHCRTLVNAAGPWVNEVAACVACAPTRSLTWVQGTHLVLDKPAPVGCFYLESPRDGRAVFVLPWQGRTMVGTTERQLTQPQAQATDEEIAYLLEVYNRYFLQARAGRADVHQVFCGTRVLPADDSSATARSRETVFAERTLGASLYIAIYGGKLTSYRATAEKVVTQLNRHLGPPTKTCSTAELPLG